MNKTSVMVAAGMIITIPMQMITNNEYKMQEMMLTMRMLMLMVMVLMMLMMSMPMALVFASVRVLFSCHAARHIFAERQP